MVALDGLHVRLTRAGSVPNARSMLWPFSAILQGIPHLHLLLFLLGCLSEQLPLPLPLPIEASYSPAPAAAPPPLMPSPPIGHTGATLGFRFQKSGLNFLARMISKAVVEDLRKIDADVPHFGHVRVLEVGVPRVFTLSPEPGTRRLLLHMLGGRAKVRVDRTRNLFLGIQSSGTVDMDMHNISFTLPLRLRGGINQLQLVVNYGDGENEGCSGNVEDVSVDFANQGTFHKLVDYWAPGKDEESVAGLIDHLNHNFCSYARSVVAERFSASFPPFLNPHRLDEELVAVYFFPHQEVDSALFATSEYIDLGLRLSTFHRGVDYCPAPPERELLKWQADLKSYDYMSSMWVSQAAVNCVLQGLMKAGQLKDFAICYPENVCKRGTSLHHRFIHVLAPEVVIRAGSDSVQLIAHLSLHEHHYPWHEHEKIKEHDVFLNASMRPQLSPGGELALFLSFSDLYDGHIKLDPPSLHQSVNMSTFPPNILPVTIPIPKLVGSQSLLTRTRIVLGDGEIRIDADFEE